MIVCKRCNNENEDGATFCGSCGEYLEWVGERVIDVTGPDTVEVPDPEAEAASPGILERVKAAVGLSGSAGSGGAPPADADVTTVRDSAVPPKDPADSEAVSATPPPPPLDHGSVAPIKSAPTPASPDQPGPRKPTVQQVGGRAKVRKGTFHPTARAGDLICGQCGESNDPSRRFCRRCGKSLSGAALARPLPWWRRLFRRRTPEPAGGRAKARRQSAAGSARRMRSGALSVGSKIKRGLLILIVVGAIVGFAVPSYRTAITSRAHDGYDWARCLFTSCETTVGLTSAKATSFVSGHEAGKAIDLNKTTMWSAKPNADDGVGQRLCINLKGIHDLIRIGILSGNQSNGGAFFGKNPTATAVQLIFMQKPCPEVLANIPTTATTLKMSLAKNDASEQLKSLDISGVGSVEIKILAVLPKAGSHTLSITEVELWTKKR